MSYPGNDDFQVSCPICEESAFTANTYNYAHMSGIEVNAGGRVTTFSGDDGGQAVSTVEGQEVTGRGTKVTLNFWFEQCQHLCDISFQFHKGNTFIAIEPTEVKIEQDPNLFTAKSADDEPEIASTEHDIIWGGDLWRD